MKRRLRNTALLSSHLHCFDEKSVNNPYIFPLLHIILQNNMIMLSFLHISLGFVEILKYGFIIFIKLEKFHSLSLQIFSTLLFLSGTPITHIYSTDFLSVFHFG